MARRRLRRLVTRGIQWVRVPVVAFVLVVAVAMMCSVWSPFRLILGAAGFAPMATEDVPKALHQRNAEITWAGETRGFGVSFYFFYVSTPGEEPSLMDPGFRQLFVARSGFPFRCLRWTDAPWNESYSASFWTRGIETRRWTAHSSTNRRIPLMPEPVGMVLNVLIVSAVIVLPRLAWRNAVVFRRKRKNLCVKCAYPLGDFAACPECGNPTGCEA